MRSLAGDGSRRSWWLLGTAIALLSAWGVWFLRVPITVYEVSAQARLEVDRAVHPLAVATAGKVVATRLQLGHTVQAGEILVELDAETERRRLEEERRRLAGLKPQLDALLRETAAAEQSLRDDREATRTALDGARARYDEAGVATRFADEEARRLEKLKEGDGISALELSRVRAEAQKKRAAADALATDTRRLEGDQRTRDSQGRAHLEQLRRDAAQLQGAIETTRAAIQVLDEAVEKHRLRAPAAGQLGEVTQLQIGAVLREGERVGTVVPGGEIRVVADFPPAAALGRIRAGQPANLRLDGFPWLQYGSLRARVETVGSEAKNGLVRVELTVPPDPTSRIPRQHGLPGTVEIEVERVPPVTLVLREAGQLLARPEAAAPSQTSR